MPFIAKARSFLRNLFLARQMEAELDEEVRTHLEMLVEEKIREGMPGDQARRAARIELGGVDQVKEQVHERQIGSWVHSVLSDCRYAVRQLRKNPGFAAAAVMTLALGIGSCTIVFSVFHNLALSPFSAKDADRLVVPGLQNADGKSQAGDGLEPLDLHIDDLDVIREQNRVFENIVGYITAGGIVLANDESQMYQFFAARVTADAFEFYGVPALLGRVIATEDGKPGAPPVFAISYGTWKSVFAGDARIVGKRFTVDGEPRTLVGVMPPNFQALGVPQEQIWIPISRTAGAPRSAVEFSANVLARLRPGVTLEAASADLDLIVKRLAVLHPNDFPKHFSVRMQKATDSYLGGGEKKKRLLYDLLAAVSMLLLIACCNVANLLLARASVREREISVRSALGGTRARLVQQLLIESCVLGIGACLVGCSLAWLGMKLVAAALPRIAVASLGGRIGGETEMGPNLPVLFFAAGITLLTILSCGLVPALHAVRSDLKQGLSNGGRRLAGSIRHGGLRAGLVTAEVSISIVLLVGAGLMARSFFALTHVDLGFNPKNVLVVVFLPPPSHNRTPEWERFASPQGRQVLRSVTERLKALPGVLAVTVEDTLPGFGPQRGPEVTVPGATHETEAGLLACDESFLKTLELRLTQGRWLSANEVESAQDVAVISHRLVDEFFKGKDPIGQQIKVKDFKSPTKQPKDRSFQIVGVVDDIKSLGPSQSAIPIIFLLYTVRGGFSLLLKTAVDPGSLTPAVRREIWAVDRDEIVALSNSVEDFLQVYAYATPEFGVVISAPLAAIALTLVIVGVFSVMAYTVSLQTHEIGVRMALGAPHLRILKMVVAKGAQLVAAGIAAGLIASYALTRLLVSQIWGVSSTDPWTFAAVVVLVTFAGLVACLIPARRASRVDPMVALRYE